MYYVNHFEYIPQITLFKYKKIVIPSKVINKMMIIIIYIYIYIYIYKLILTFFNIHNIY